MTKEEIIEFVQSIDDNKALGNDGYNVHFYKKAWPTIGGDIVEAVLQFFGTNSLFIPINCTRLYQKCSIPIL